MSLNPEAYAIAKSIFHRALELEESERLNFINQECSGKDDIRAEVLSLLRYHESSQYPRAPSYSRVKIAFEMTRANCLQRNLRKLVNQRPARLTILVVLLLLLLIAGFLVRESLRKSQQHEIAGHLESVIDSNYLAMDLWARNHFEEVNQWSTRLTTEPALLGLLKLAKANPNARDLLAGAPEQAAIRTALEGGLNLGPFQHFVIYDDRFQTIASDVPVLIGARLTQNPNLVAIYERVLAGERALAPRALFGSASRDPTLLAQKRYLSWFGVPIRNSSGVIVAGLSLAVEATRKFDHIVAVGRWGESGETYAFNAHGKMISESRFHKLSGTDFELKDPGGDLTAGFRPENPAAHWPYTRLVSQALENIRGQSGVTKGQILEPYRDYRGVLVIGSWRWHPGLNFGLITEIDAEEALATLGFVDVIFIVLGLVVIIISLLATTFSFTLIRLGPQARIGARMGQYTLLRKIAEGGIGEIYLARHEFLKRPTAIKILRRDVTDTEALSRFEKEVRATSQLSHPNTVAIYDFGRTSDQRFYYAMEFLPGISLARLIEIEEVLPVNRAVHLLQQVCASLKEAHALGLIHRDIKPLNIMICRIGGEFDFVKVVDFGLVKSIKDVVLSEATDSLPRSLRGTPAYIAPELLNSPLTANVRTDVYSLGVVAYKMLTGISLFNSISEAILLYDVLHTEPVPISQLRSNVPPALSQLIMRSVDKNPLQRPQNMDDFSRDLKAIPLDHEWTQAQARLWWNTRDHLLLTDS